MVLGDRSHANVITMRCGLEQLGIPVKSASVRDERYFQIAEPKFSVTSPEHASSATLSGFGKQLDGDRMQHERGPSRIPETHDAGPCWRKNR